MATTDAFAPVATASDASHVGAAQARAALLAGMMLVALGVAAWARTPAGTAAAAAYEAELAAVLALMAAIKTGMVAVVTVLLWWRLAQPIAAARAGAYLVCAWTMSAATVAVWTLAAVGAAAVAFHAAELTLLVLAVGDRGPLVSSLCRRARQVQMPAEPRP